METLFTTGLLGLAGGVLWFFPAGLLRSHSPGTSMTTALFAVMGFYVSFLYVVPHTIPLWIAPSLLISFLVLTSKPLKLPSLPSSHSYPLLLLVLYCFLPMLFRWEPPGTDPIKWGSYARLIWEYNAVIGDTWPLSPIRNIQGINLGSPVQISLLKMISFQPWERCVFFVECLSLLLFFTSLRGLLVRWFPLPTASWTALISCMLFSNPQQYLNWGGTPTLLGFCAGFEFLKAMDSEKEVGWLSKISYALAITFCAHAHPIGIYLSFVVCLPIWFSFLYRNRKGFGNSLQIKRATQIGFISAFFFSPFLLYYGNQVSAAELDGVKELHRKMAPFLYRDSLSMLYNLYIQTSTYIWNTAFWISWILFLVTCFRSRGIFWEIFILPQAIIALLILNSKYWILPLSFLIYPERAGTLLVFPLSFGLAFFLTDLEKKLPKFIPILITLLLVAGGYQFSRILLPNITGGSLSRADREVMAKIPDLVPKGECIELTSANAGLWIAVLSFRCTLPNHPLSESVQDELMPMWQSHRRFRYYTNQETSPNTPPPILFSEAAKLVLQAQ